MKNHCGDCKHWYGTIKHEEICSKALKELFNGVRLVDRLSFVNYKHRFARLHTLKTLVFMPMVFTISANHSKPSKVHN